MSNTCRIAPRIAAAFALAGWTLAAVGAEPVDLEKRLEELAEQKRAKALAVVAKSQEAIVQVDIVVNLKMKVGGQEPPAQDQKLSLPGTVISADGVVAVSNAAADPGPQMEAQLRRNPQLRNAEIDVQASIKEIRIILADSSELEAEVAIRDEDLSVLLLRPKEKPEKEMPFVALDVESKPRQLDQVLAVARMGVDAGRAVMVSVGMVNGIIEKPRTYYVVMPISPGLPVFDKDGRCFGLCLPRKSAEGLALGNQFVLPAADVIEILAQVKQR